MQHKDEPSRLDRPLPVVRSPHGSFRTGGRGRMAPDVRSMWAGRPHYSLPDGSTLVASTSASAGGFAGECSLVHVVPGRRVQTALLLVEEGDPEFDPPPMSAGTVSS